VTELLLIVGGSVFGFLGLLHALYTFADTRRPPRLAPDDPAMLESMRSSSLRLSRGQPIACSVSAGRRTRGG